MKPVPISGSLRVMYRDNKVPNVPHRMNFILSFYSIDMNKANKFVECVLLISNERMCRTFTFIDAWETFLTSLC